MSTKEILLVLTVTAITLVLMIFYLFIDIVSIFGFCKKCGARIRAWDIIAFKRFSHPINLYISEELHDTGISLFLGRCRDHCEISAFNSIRYGLFGKTRKSKPCFSEIKTLIEDSNTILLREFLSEYEKKHDSGIRDELKETLKESLCGKEAPWQKELCSAWNEYKIKYLSQKKSLLAEGLSFVSVKHVVKC